MFDRAVRFLISSTLATAACASEDYSQLYASANIAPSLEPVDIKNLEHLGATLIDQGANFGIYSERATRVDVLLFDDPEAELPTQQFSLTRFGDVWNVYVEGVGLGQHYGYVAWGPNWPEDPDWYPGSIHGFIEDVDLQGNRFNPNKLLMDPYARAFHRDFDWSKGSAGTGHHRTYSSYAAASKGIITESQYRWSDNEASWLENRRDPDMEGHRWTDLIIYEVHAKGFTAGGGSGVEHPGTFDGFGEMADYLADLGITAVELLPPFEKPPGNDGTYWGYNTLNYFTPEITFCWQKQREECADELKGMIDQLHQHGIEVILDVVYNHTGELGLWRDKNELFPDDFYNVEPEEVANLFSYRGLDNHAYYVLSNDNRSYLEVIENFRSTGVGNQARCNHTPMRRLIMDSLRYWVEEMHIDGFRFDLAPVLAEPDGERGAWPEPITATVIQEIIDEPLFRTRNIRIIAEPWSLHQFALGRFPAATADPSFAWLEWNGHFRDVWRAFINWDDRGLNATEGPVDLGAALTASAVKFDDDGRRPYHSVNFITVHDGFTLYDLVSYNEKHNLCGVLNPVCCWDQGNLTWCDPGSGDDYNRSRDWRCSAHTDKGESYCAGDALPTCYWHCEWGNCYCQSEHRENASYELPGHQGITDNEPFKRQIMRDFFVAMMISHGTPMLMAGDEWMRTQYGNNNAYQFSADNKWNWLQWGTWEPRPERQRMRDFVRNLTRFRKAHAYAFAPEQYGGGAPFSWKNNDLQPADWGSRHLMIHYDDDSRGPELLVLINMESWPVDFALPPGRTWRRLIDTQHFFDREEEFAPTQNPNISTNITLDEPLAVPGPSYGVYTRSIVVLEAATP